MITSIKRDNDSAIRADQPAGISKSGAYVGTISQCAAFETQNGATGVEIAFKTDEGVLCFSTLYILSKTGERTFNHDILDAVMVVAGVDNAPIVQAKVYERDGTISEYKNHRIPSLEKKHIGLILQRENYVNQAGRMSYRMNIVSAFDPQTKRLAKEILTGEPEAKMFFDRLKNLKDKEPKHNPADEVPPPPTYEAGSDDPF